MSSMSKKGAANPRQLNVNVELTHKFRFKATGAFNGAITDTLILNALGGVSVTAVLAHPIAQSVKIHSVEIWAALATQGATADISIEWPTQGQNKSREVQDSTLSTARVAHIHSKPPPQSLAGFWTNGTGNTVFLLNIPSGTIVDLNVSYVLLDGAVSSISQVTVGATVGALYYGYLDSLTAAGALLQPLGLTPMP